MDWEALYRARTTTAPEAVGRIRSGDRVVVAHACGEPSHVLDAMVDNAAAYRDVEIVHLVAMGKSAYCAPEHAEHFRHNSLFLGGSTRQAIAEGRGDFTPCFFFELPKLFSTSMRVDVALVTVTPPDENGMCSLGVSVDYTLEAVRRAALVIAQVNARMPYTLGQSTVPVSDIDCFVPCDAPILELLPPHIGPVEEAIGRNCASLIRDGDTLQLGIGAIPDAVLRFLTDKHDLGLHSELLSDGAALRLRPPQPGFNDGAGGLCKRPQGNLQKRQYGLHQFLRSSGSNGPGGLGEHRPTADFRRGRAGGFRAGGSDEPGRPVHHRHGFHREKRTV